MTCPNCGNRDDSRIRVWTDFGKPAPKFLGWECLCCWHKWEAGADLRPVFIEDLTGLTVPPPDNPENTRLITGGELTDAGVLIIGQSQPPTPEGMTIGALMAATKEAFDPRDEHGVTPRQSVKIAAALIKFCEVAGEMPTRTFDEWKQAFLNLSYTLKGDVDAPQR